jgi:hypothetical protein
VIKIYREHYYIILIKNVTIIVSAATLIKMFVYCAIPVLLETNLILKDTL